MIKVEAMARSYKLRLRFETMILGLWFETFAESYGSRLWLEPKALGYGSRLFDTVLHFDSSCGWGT